MAVTTRRTMLLVDYSELPQFAKYHLEDGFLLDVREDDCIEFTVEAALTYAHPVYPQRTLWTKIIDALVRDLPPYKTDPALGKDSYRFSQGQECPMDRKEN
jgi:hypothetical protein